MTQDKANVKLKNRKVYNKIKNTMDNYLIDREMLSQFIDELIKKKPLSVNTTEELSNFREEQIKSLDDKIGKAIFSRLTDEQAEEFSRVLDQNEEGPEIFEAFFDHIGIDVEEIIYNTMESFGKEFLEGGKNV